MKANKALMIGAGRAADKFQDYRIGKRNEDLSRQMQMKRMYEDKEIRKYIDNLGPGAEIDKLPGSMQKPVTDFLNSSRMKYGELARRVAKTPAGSPFYMQARSEMNKIQSQFKNLSSQLDNFKNLKQEYLSDFDSGVISKGSDSSILKRLFSTDDYLIDLSNGSLEFTLNDGSKVSASNLPKYFNRNAKAVNGLLKLNQQAYKNALPIDKTSDYLYRRQVRQLVTQGGRDGLLSLATDVFLDNAMIDVDNLNDPNYYLLAEENHEQLRDFVINSWMDGISTASNEAYTRKQRRSKPQGSGLDYATVLKIWQSGDLDQLTNLLPLDSKVSFDGYDDGTYDIKLGSIIKGKNIDPTNPDHLQRLLTILGVSGGGRSSSSVRIDLDKI